MADSNPLKPSANNTNPQQTQGQLTPSIDQIMQMCPDTTRRNVEKYWPLVARAMAEKGLTSRNQTIAALATIYVETGTFAPIKEAGRAFRYDPYRGRGFIQITWRDNYAKAGKALGLGDQLVNNPDMTMEPELAGKIFVWYWTVGTTYNVSQYAEKGDFANVRSIVNRGHPNKLAQTTQSGTKKFLAAIERGVKYITSGIDPNSIGSLPSNYGLGCADCGSAGQKTLNGLSPNTQMDALLYALGIHKLHREKAYVFTAELDVASQPEILNLEAQKTFEVKGFGGELDGTYTVDEIIFFFGKTLTAEITAYKADPNAPPPQIFLHDPSGKPLPSELVTSNTTTTSSSVPAGDIPARIFAAGNAARGSNTSDGPDGGKNACAFALNKFCILPAGLKSLGSPVSPWGHPVAVAACEDALKNGRGQLVSRKDAVPGDIWLISRKHIGICTTPGCTRVLSNSSSKAKFQWEDDIDKVNSYYGGQKEKIYRVTS